MLQSMIKTLGSEDIMSGSDTAQTISIWTVTYFFSVSEFVLMLIKFKIK